MAKKKPLLVSQSGCLPITDGAAIDLASLCDMHPRLPGEMAGVMVIRAALGPQRNKHSSGQIIHMAIETAALRSALV